MVEDWLGRLKSGYDAGYYKVDTEVSETIPIKKAIEGIGERYVPWYWGWLDTDGKEWVTDGEKILQIGRDVSQQLYSGLKKMSEMHTNSSARGKERERIVNATTARMVFNNLSQASQDKR